MVNLVILIICSAGLITLSMLFSISESSFLSMNKLKLRILRKKNDRRAVRVSRLLEKKELLINTLLVANDLVNILLSSILTAVFLELFGQSGVGIATLVVTVLLLIFGEITPKSISTRNPDGIAYALSGFVQFVMWIIKPLVLVLTYFSRIILKIRRIDVKSQKRSYTEEDIKSFIEAGGESGVLEKGEKNMMNRVFKFTDLAAENIMIPRTSIVAVPLDLSYRRLIEFAQASRYSRFPVYKENLDDIVGILYLKDLLKLNQEEIRNFSLSKVMRKPLFIPGTQKMSSVQQILYESHQSMAIVIDEYSGTDGILTKQDLYREIFGTYENNSLWHKTLDISSMKEKNNFDVDGSILLLDFNEIAGIKLESEINETLGGWIIEKLNRMPQKGDRIKFSGYSFQVKNVVRRRISEIKVRKLQNSDQGEE